MISTAGEKVVRGGEGRPRARRSTAGEKVVRGGEGRLRGRRWFRVEGGAGKGGRLRGGCRCRLIISELFALLQFTLRGGVDRVVKPAGSSLSWPGGEEIHHWVDFMVGSTRSTSESTRW